jgi:hypothetical protein
MTTATAAYSTIGTGTHPARDADMRGHPLVLRLLPCVCGARMRSISLNGERVEGSCLRCGEWLHTPLATEPVELVRVLGL